MLTFLKWVIFLFVGYQLFLLYSDYIYPRNFFANKLEIEHVIASKRWHHEAVGCTYVIVKYKDGSSPKLVSSDKKILTNQESSSSPWLGKWEKTPFIKRSIYQQYFDITGINCLYKISPILLKDISVLLKTEGSWYSIGSEGFSFTSEVSNIAMYVRYSD